MPKPRPISGFPEWNPAETFAEQSFLRTVVAVYESYGYTPSLTPRRWNGWRFLPPKVWWQDKRSTDLSDSKKTRETTSPQNWGCGLTTRSPWPAMWASTSATSIFRSSVIKSARFGGESVLRKVAFESFTRPISTSSLRTICLYISTRKCPE